MTRLLLRVLTLALLLAGVTLIIIQCAPAPTPTATPVPPAPILAPIGGAKGYITFKMEKDGKESLYVISSDDTELTELVTGADWVGAWSSPDSAKLAVLVMQNDRWALLTLNPDGSGRVELVTDAYSIWPLEFSPDGSKLVVTVETGEGESSAYSVLVINVDGSGRVDLVENTPWGSFGNFSPDGRRVAISVGDPDNISAYSVFVTNADGSERVNLLNNALYTYWRLPFSPDSTALLLPVEGDEGQFLRLVNVDGSGYEDLVAAEYVGAIAEYSPDFRYLATWIVREGDDLLLVMHPDGSDQRVVWRRSTKAGEEGFLSFSSDGSGLVFRATTGQDRQTSTEQIFLVSADGAQQLELATQPTREGELYPLAFSPDASKILVEVQRGEDYETMTYDLLLINTDRSGRIYLATQAAWEVGADFSPDSQWLVFDSNREGGRAVYIARADGSDITKLVDDGYAPTWHPTSR